MKKMIYGLAIAAMAVGVSAFTTVNMSNEVQSLQTRYWINDGTNYVLTEDEPDPVGNCETPSSAQCAIQSEDTSVPSSFPIGNVGLYDVDPVPGSKIGEYQL